MPQETGGSALEANGLYPIHEPFQTGHLQVSDLHRMYYEVSGNPRGPPIAFVHGGPGSHTKPDFRGFFDPTFYKIIMFDQRGGGQSTPSAELRENTTQDLVQDMEKLRDHLGLEDWILFGGSWGSTLTAAYSIEHPKRVKGRILRGMFLCRPSEINWFYENGGAENIFPDAWEEFVAPIPEQERDHLVAAYHKRLTSDNLQVRIEAAQAWAKWEAKTSKLRQDPSAGARFDDPTEALAFAGIENHYFFNRIFLPEHYLMDCLPETRSIPTRMVQGRYDVVCPPKTAWEVKNKLGLLDSEFIIIPDAGHSPMEPGTRVELVRATDDFKTLYR
ncbi:MAG: prolyl aminopeptidase [Candidatus Woesearchaeota archaeon]